MNNGITFGLTLLLAAAGPVLALRYLQPILRRVLRSQCESMGGAGGDDAADFWLRSAYVLALCGTLLLALSFGDFGLNVFESLRRALWLVAAGTFATVAFVALQVWAPVGLVLDERRLRVEAGLSAARTAAPGAASGAFKQGAAPSVV